MPNFRLEEFTTRARGHNVLATFTARFDFVAVKHMALCRQGDAPKLTFVRPPKDRDENRPAVSFDAAIFRQIGERATAAYNTITGESLVYGTPPGRDGLSRRAPAPDTAGGRRVIGAEYAQEMTRAGLD